MKTIFRALSATFGMFALCMMVLGCQSDEESYDGKTMSLQEAKMEILRLANEYDLNVSLNDSILESKLPTLDLKEIEAQMEAVASLKGTYTKIISKDSKDFTISSSNNIISRSMRASTTTESETDVESPSSGIFGTHSSLSPLNDKIERLSIDITVSWSYSKKEDSKVLISNVSVWGKYKNNYHNGDNFNGEGSGTVDTFEFTGKTGSFTFRGKIKVEIATIGTDFDLNYNGSYSNGSGTITLN